MARRTGAPPGVGLEAGPLLRAAPGGLAVGGRRARSLEREGTWLRAQRSVEAKSPVGSS